MNKLKPLKEFVREQWERLKDSPAYELYRDAPIPNSESDPIIIIKKSYWKYQQKEYTFDLLNSKLAKRGIDLSQRTYDERDLHLATKVYLESLRDHYLLVDTNLYLSQRWYPGFNFIAKNQFGTASFSANFNNEREWYPPSRILKGPFPTPTVKLIYRDNHGTVYLPLGWHYHSNYVLNSKSLTTKSLMNLCDCLISAVELSKAQHIDQRGGCRQLFLLHHFLPYVMEGIRNFHSIGFNRYNFELINLEDYPKYHLVESKLRDLEGKL